MNESYAEAVVHKKMSSSDYLLMGIAILFLLFVVIVGGAFFGQFALMFAVILGLVFFYSFKKFFVDYEYVFCDGQLDFDKIMGGTKRKTALRIDFEKVEIMAPVKSHALDSYRQNKQLKRKDFSSRTSGAKVYTIIARENADLLEILFEPNEKMLTCIKQKSPRKVSEC